MFSLLVGVGVLVDTGTTRLAEGATFWTRGNSACEEVDLLLLFTLDPSIESIASEMEGEVDEYEKAPGSTDTISPILPQ